MAENKLKYLFLGYLFGKGFEAISYSHSIYIDLEGVFNFSSKTKLKF